LRSSLDIYRVLEKRTQRRFRSTQPILLSSLTNCEKYHGVEPFNTVNYARFKAGLSRRTLHRTKKAVLRFKAGVLVRGAATGVDENDGGVFE
jgi:hypothetical protein